jgi:hypothetical protein
MTAVVEELQRQYNATIMAWEVERVIGVLRHREGNIAGERTSLDRMKALGTVANDLERRIAEALRTPVPNT